VRAAPLVTHGEFMCANEKAARQQGDLLFFKGE
jgi:hypothetical protein